MAVKKRTLGDDLRDFKAGKAPDGYRNNIKNTTPYAIKSWQYSDGFVGGEYAFDNPIYGDNSEEINVNNSQNTLGNTAKNISSNNKKAEEKKKPVIKNTNEFAKFGQNALGNPKQGIKTEKDEKKQQYILDLDNSGGLPSSEEISAVGNAALSPVGKITTEADKYREYENEYKDYSYEQFKSEAEKVDDKADNGWKKKWFDSAIVEKRNEFYSDKYKDYDYKKLKTESSNNKLSDEEREWLKNTADEKATSAELQAEYDSLTKEYNTLYDSRDEESSYNRLKEIEDRQEDLKSLIEKKKYEEKKKAEYDDVIENDIKAKTIMQKYYYLQKYDELNRMFESTGHGIESVKVKSSIDAYNYAKDLTPEERKQIIKDFNSLENKDTLYKYYKREREEQETAEQNQILNDYSEEHPVLGSLASMGLNTYGSVEDTVKYAGAGIDKAFGGDGYVNPDSTNVAKAQLIREKVSEDMDGLGKFFYNTGMSIGDNLARMPLLALPGGEAMSLALAGTSAGVSSANDVINSGGSLESALWTGAAAGTAEVVFEKIPLDNLIKLKREGTESVFLAVLNQMKTEGLEEVGTDIANAITDQIINGDMSQLALQYQNYIAQGYSEEEARKQIAFDFASQLGQSFAAGAISGGVLSGGTVAFNKIGETIGTKSEKRKSASQLGREALQSENFDVNELIGAAKKSNNQKAVNLAKSLEKVVEEKGADKVKAVDVGNLLTLTNSDEITYDYSQDLSELTGTDKQNIIDRNFELNGEEKTAKTSNNSEVKYTDTKAFGENYPHGLGAKISKTGERITIVGLKSSAKDFNSDDNTVVLLADNGELYDSDDIRTSVPYYNDLFDYAKNFDTIGARVYLSQYEDYAKRSKANGKTADIAEYSKCFERLYSYGVKGVTYDSIKKSGNFTREINILSAGVAYSAVQSGNNDFKVDTRDKSNKSQKIRMPGESNSISSKVYVDPGSEDSVKVTDEQLAILQAVADKTGREIVLTDRMGERTGDENANGGYNPNDGKIYINAEVHDSYMLSVSLHEAVHGVAADNPSEYHALCTFITNYLVAKGENIDNLLDDIKIKWGDSVHSEDAALEELVCQTVMAIATDEVAIKTALSLEENKGILKKVASVLKRIAKAAYDFIKGVGIQAHNKQAQPWINDIEALNELAVRLEKAFESTRKLNEQRASAAESTETEQKNNTADNGDVKYSIVDDVVDDNGKHHSEIVLLDTKLFNGTQPRYWGKIIIDFVYNNLLGKQVKVLDENGNKVTVEFAKKNDRVTKSGANNSHKVVDKLARKTDNISRLAVAHAIELIEVSEYENSTDLHSHQWLDENGWEYRYAEIMDNKGNIYSACLNIAKTKDGRNILYDINKISNIGHGVVPSNAKSKRGSHINPNVAKNNLPQNNNNVKHSVDDVINENRDLVAVHNLSAKKLAKMISDFDGQGIPAPSIAIDKADNVHSDFGEISLIFDRNTIDPKADRRNSVYSRDAWTSMYPKTEFKLNEKAMKKLAERLDMSVNELKTNMFDTSDIQKIKYRFEDDIKVRKAFLNENNIKVTPVLRDRQPDIMMFSARAVKKFVRNNDCTFDRLVNDKEFRNELFKAYSDGASLKGIANAHIKETDEILDLAKSEEFYSVLKEKFDYAIEYAKGNVQQTEGSMTEAVNNAIEEYKEEFDRYIDGLLSSGVLGEEYIVRDDVDPYDENGNRKPFSKTHYKYNIENVVKAMKSGRSKVGSSFTGGVAYVKSIGAKKLNSIDEIKGNRNKIVPMSEEELEAENERISDLIKPLIQEVADSGSYNNDFITASNNIVDAFNSKKDVNGVYNYLKQYHDKIKMSTVKKLFAAKAEIENLPTRYFEAKPHRVVGFDEVKAAVIPADTHEALKGALKELGVPMYEYDSNNENSRAEVTQKAINTEYVDNNGEKRGDLRFSKDDTIVDYSDLTALDDEEIKVYYKRGWTYQLFTNEDRKLLDGEFAKLSPVETQRTDNLLGDGSRMVEINNKVVLIGGSFDEPEIYCVFAINADNETEADIYKELLFNEKQKYDRNRYRYTDCLQSIAHNIGETFVRAYIASDFRYYKGHKDYGERAVLPSNFKNYEYTEQFQDGEGDNPKAGRNVSKIKLAVDDTITDGMFTDGDLFDEDGYIQQSVFERAVKDNPDFVLTAVYNHAAKTAETAIKQSSDVKLDDKAYLLVARRLMTRYDISRKLNKGFDEELAQTIRKHIERMEKGVADFAGELELLVDDCKEALMLSGKLDGETFKTEREEILGFLRGKTLILTEYAESDVRGDYDTLQNYRKRMFGKINVAYEKNLKKNSKGLFWDSGNNIYIDDVIAFVEEHFPYLITDDADDISGYRWLDNLVNNVLKPKFVNNYIDGFSENVDTAAIEMAFDVTTEIINAKAKYAVADSKTERKYIRKIAIAKEQAAAEQRALLKAKVESYSDKAKEERSKRIMMIENLRRRMSEITDKSDKQRLKYEAQIDKLKSLLDAKTIILNMGYETIREQYNENRTKTVYREKLGRMLDRMTKKLDGKANNNEYIPEVLKKPILDVLSSFTADPGTYKNGKKKALPGYYGEWKNIAKIGDRVNELTIAYESLKSKEDSKEKKYSFIDVNSIAFREGTLEVLKYLSENLSGKNIYDLSANDLIDIYEAMQELDNSLRSAVEIILNGQKMSVQEAANRAIAETESVKYKKDVQRFSNTAVNVVAGTPREIKNKFLATQLDPVRYGRKLSGYHDDYVISQVMRELHEGDKKRTRIMQECFVRVQAVTSNYSKSEIKGLQRNDVTEFNFKEQKTGKRVKVSQGMLLAIYLTDRQADGHRHLVNENFNHYTVIPDLDMMNLGRDGMTKSHRVRFSEADLRAIKQYVENNKMLSELAGAISEVYNTILNQYINEVSMAKYGKLIATVKNYYPLWVYSDGAHYEKNFEAEFNDIRMRSRRHTKHRTKSYAPIVINDVLKTFTNSVQSVSEYCGLLIPIENFKSIYNSGNGDVTLHEAIKEKFGESAEHYIEKLMADLQNAPEILDNTWLQKAQGNYMGAKLLANPGAAIKQLAAFPTAFNYFGVKNVTAAAAVGMAKIDFDLYAKYTPYLWYRKNGNGTVIGELSREIGFYKKSMDRIDIMGKMDRYVVGCLLYAAELHVEQTTDLKRGTDAFYKEVVRQFEKCVDETQPNNMITSKPQFIRNNVMKLLSLNAFKSQNMAIANCVIDSYGEFAARKAEYKESKTEEAKAAKNEAAKKFAGSVIGAVCSSALIGILTVAVNLFIWHKWDDFKDEEGNVTPLTILQNFTDYSLESLAGCFAWGDKAYEAICAGLDLGKFFGFEVMSVDTLNDAIDNLTKGKLLDFAANIADMFGLPMENGLRILRSISSYANDIVNGNGEIITENNSLQWENNTSYFNFIIVEAKQKGETEKAEHFEQLWKDDLINKQGKTEKLPNDTIKTKLVTALAASDDDVEQAALAKVNGDLSSYEEHMNKVVGYGFDSVDVKKAVDKVIKNVADDVKNRGLEEKADIIADLKNQGFNDKGAEYVYKSMQSGESSESEDELSAFSDTSEGEGVAYTYSDTFEYLKNGDIENYERVEQYLIDNNGKTKKDVQSAMRSASRTDKLWKAYFEAQGTLSGGGDPVKLEEYKKILTNIYGSWSTAVTYGRKYQKRMKEKEKQNNK
ncbi:MAG: hypothetical protein ACI4GX_02720 [Ruminococcus sp.]